MGIEVHQAAVGVLIRMKKAGESIADPDDLPALLSRRDGSPLDDGVDARHKAGAHHDGDALIVGFHNCSIS